MRPLLGSILGWLRAGYPDGIPPKDYVPLLAVLRRKLTDAEVREVVAMLAAEQPTVDRGSEATEPESPITPADIEATIVRLTHDEPLEDDVRRVAARLAAGGWPLAEIPHSDRADAVDIGAVRR